MGRREGWRPSGRMVAWGVLAAAVMAGGGCRSGGPVAVATEAGVAPADGSVALPEPAPELAPLVFLTGRWAAVNPNQTINREHWMSPRGRTMAGMFVQYRRDGSASFYEMSAIVSEADGVKLFLRHLHRKLEIDERRSAVDVFVLRSAEPGRAVFAPEKDVPGGVETMTYRADGPDRLVQELVFKPDSKEKPFSTVYTREP